MRATKPRYLLITFALFACEQSGKPLDDRPAKEAASQVTLEADVRKSTKGKTPGEPIESATMPCSALPSGTAKSHPTAAAVGYASHLLREADQGLAPIIAEQAKRAIAGGPRSDSAEGGPVGVEFLLERFKLGPANCLAETENAITLQRSDALSAHAELLPSPSSEVISKTFKGWQRDDSSDGPEAGAYIAARVEQYTSELKVYKTRGTRDGVIVSGVMLVDPQTRESLWVLARVIPVQYRKR